MSRSNSNFNKLFLLAIAAIFVAILLAQEVSSYRKPLQNKPREKVYIVRPKIGPDGKETYVLVDQSELIEDDDGGPTDKRSIGDERAQRFCPLEIEGNRCISRLNQFKCAAFFEDLSGREDFLTWIAAFPDMLWKNSAKNSNAFRGMSKRKFRIDVAECSEKHANKLCYDMLRQLYNVPMDSCKQNLLNDNPSSTIGNTLCQKAGLFVPNQSFQSFVKIGFYHSYCGSDWAPVTDPNFGIPLKVKEELCCKYDSTGSHFFSCDKREFNTTCVA